MRCLIPVLVTMLLAGCESLPSEIAVCSGTEAMRRDHARGLLTDGGPVSQATGERLLTGLRAGCGE